MRIRAASLDVTITADGPGAGSPEVSAVMAQIRDLIAPPEPVPLVIGPQGNRRQRRAAARQGRRA